MIIKKIIEDFSLILEHNNIDKNFVYIKKYGFTLNIIVIIAEDRIEEENALFLAEAKINADYLETRYNIDVTIIDVTTADNTNNICIPTDFVLFNNIGKFNFTELSAEYIEKYRCKAYNYMF